MKKKLAGFAFVLLSVAIMSVSAFVYDQATQTIGQTIVEIADITLNSPALGNLEEGETKSYTKVDVPQLGAAISLTTTKANVYLHLDSDVQALGSLYTTYTLTVKYITVPSGSSLSGTAATLTLAAPDAVIALDTAGAWAFDFELTTTAKLVSSDQSTAASIVVTAEST